jgi:phosphoribosyl-ATP pyrophosphohydrolase/phosphoribosyl-AMP cyclohydrolase
MNKAPTQALPSELSCEQIEALQAANWDKGQGLLPAIVQHARTGQVLMQAFFSPTALTQTLNSGWVTFYSRSRQALWTKGETSGNRLGLVSIQLDCDQDSFLIQALPQGPVCHTGAETCWDQGRLGQAPRGVGFIAELAEIIQQRASSDDDNSYTAHLLKKGIARIAQKVGEEGVETALAAVTESDEALIGESADLIYHLLVLLQARGIPVEAVTGELSKRHQQSR